MFKKDSYDKDSRDWKNIIALKNKTILIWNPHQSIFI